MQEDRYQIEERREKKREECLLFQQWFFDNWIASGGMITKKVAADLLDITQGRISYLIKKGRLKVRKYNRYEFLELTQIKVMLHHKLYKYLRRKLEEETEKMPETQRDSFRATMMKIYDQQERQIEPLDKSLLPSKTACDSTSITKRAKPQTRPSRKSTAKNAGETPAPPRGQRVRVRKAV